MKRLGIAVTTVICIGLSALLAQAATVHYSFNETAVGNWDVYVEVTGEDTAGLSAYAVWVVDVAPGTCSWAQNALSVLDPKATAPYFQTVGFLDPSFGDTVYPPVNTVPSTFSA